MRKLLINGQAPCAVIATVVWTAALLSATTGAQPTSSSTAENLSRIESVSSVGCTVGDLDRSLAFYSQVLGFEKLAEREEDGEQLERLTGVFGARCRTAQLKLGSEFIELTQFLAPEGQPVPADSRSNDRWFQHIAIVVSDMERAYQHLRSHRVRHASSGPQTLPAWNPNAGGISAFYFKDPDGHSLEIIHFPVGKGDPRWQDPGEKLFLGIDHTAIVVADTERSLRLYRDALGMCIAGTSENYGTEQDHLNNVFGARLRITSLRAVSGPGIELLEYLAPSGGRPYPEEARPNDLLTWTTTLVSPNTQVLAEIARSAGATWVSSGFVYSERGGVAALRDPDGHVLRVEQSAAPLTAGRSAK